MYQSINAFDQSVILHDFFFAESIIEVMFFQIKYSILARSIYSHWVERVERFLICEDFPILLPPYALFTCENTASASNTSGGFIHVVFASFW
jgi:hypothetical protein